VAVDCPFLDAEIGWAMTIGMKSVFVATSMEVTGGGPLPQSRA
jgi:hypothetical protein